MPASTPITADRLAALRAEIAAQGLDGMILTTADAFQNEDPPPQGRAIEWLTGFTGSLAHALILRESAVFLVDGRYGIQATQELDTNVWQIGHLLQKPLAQWLRAMGARIGYDPMCWTVAQCDLLRKEARSIVLTPLHDPLAGLWSDRPPPPLSPIRLMPEAESGRSAADKLHWLHEQMAMLGADVWIETRPDNIAWLFNIRGADVPMNPLALSFAIIARNQPALWFIDAAKLTQPVPEGVQPLTYDAFLPRLAALGAGQIAAFDPAFTPDAVATALHAGGSLGLQRPGLITIEKSRKTPAELGGFRRAHLADAVALARFGAWLEQTVVQRDRLGRPLSETEAAQVLEGFRKTSNSYLEPSFTTIAAVGENAALCHYHPPEQGSGLLRKEGIFLCDSGGQYLCGTTDVTRTFAFAPVAPERRRIATAVLRGFIALHDARFPNGTMPHQLDALARLPLWALGLDYDHGTGHDVGHNLLIHEHPHRIGKAANPFPLAAGHVITLEPGYYAEGDWGIRIENQVEVVQDEGGYLRFDALTLAPIDLTLFDLATLGQTEKDWIDRYHARVRAEIAPLLEAEVAQWLIRTTRAIALYLSDESSLPAN